MSEEVLIKVEGLGKKFCKDLKKSLQYGVQDVARSLVGKSSKQDLRKGEFWALKDINFELKRGECLGLLGHNGAGKSTLLKVLNGLIKPDEGKVTIRGRVGALIELGAGFNPILTGRENIYNNASVLGFSKEETNAKLEDIIEFSEIREFIDTPVQNYSSGMKVRLGFAIAAQMEPDVLFIDEVLAVGDVAFRSKCYERLGELLSKTCVVFVSHSMPQVSRISTSVLLLNKGDISFKGEVNIGVEKYFSAFSSKIAKNKSRFGERISGIKIKNLKAKYEYGEKCCFSLVIDSSIYLSDVELNIVLLSREEIPVAQINTSTMQLNLKLQKGVNEFKMTTGELFLNTGVYYLSLTIFDKAKRSNVVWLDKFEEIYVSSKFIGSAPYLIPLRIHEDI